MIRTTALDDQEELCELARTGSKPFRAAARAILDLQDRLNEFKSQPEHFTATALALQNDNYTQARRIDGYQKEIAGLHNRIQGLAGERLGLRTEVDTLKVKLQKTIENWEKAGRESAQNLARALEAEQRYENAVKAVAQSFQEGSGMLREKYLAEGKAAEFERIVGLLDTDANNRLALVRWPGKFRGIGPDEDLFGDDLREALKDTAK